MRSRSGVQRTPPRHDRSRGDRRLSHFESPFSFAAAFAKRRHVCVNDGCQIECNELGEQQLDELLRTEISRIPPVLRQVMLLYDVEQLSMPEVAARLGLSVPAAKSRLMRARVEMRLRLSKHCGRRGYGSLTRKAKYNRAAYAREN